jgi:hypothetical protein
MNRDESDVDSRRWRFASSEAVGVGKMRADNIESYEADRWIRKSGSFDVFDARSGDTRLVVGSEWLAKLLTAPTWNGPRWFRRLYGKLGLHDYTEHHAVRIAYGRMWTNLYDDDDEPNFQPSERTNDVCSECGRPYDGSPDGWHCVKRY